MYSVSGLTFHTLYFRIALGRFTPGERASDKHWVGGWFDPEAGLDVVTKRIMPTAAVNRTPVVQPVVIVRDVQKHVHF